MLSYKTGRTGKKTFGISSEQKDKMAMEQFARGSGEVKRMEPIDMLVHDTAINEP